MPRNDMGIEPETGPEDRREFANAQSVIKQKKNDDMKKPATLADQAMQTGRQY